MYIYFSPNETQIFDLLIRFKTRLIHQWNLISVRQKMRKLQSISNLIDLIVSTYLSSFRSPKSASVCLPVSIGFSTVGQRLNGFERWTRGFARKVSLSEFSFCWIHADFIRLITCTHRVTWMEQFAGSWSAVLGHSLLVHLTKWTRPLSSRFTSLHLDWPRGRASGSNNRLLLDFIHKSLQSWSSRQAVVLACELYSLFSDRFSSSSACSDPDHKCRVHFFLDTPATDPIISFLLFSSNFLGSNGVSLFLFSFFLVCCVRVASMSSPLPFFGYCSASFSSIFPSQNKHFLSSRLIHLHEMANFAI